MTHRFSWLLGWSRLGMSLLAGALVAVAGCSAEPIDARRAALASSCLAGEVHREIRLGALLTAERRAGLAALGVHVALDGTFETRTVAAMTVRSVFWIGQALALAHTFKNQAGSLPNTR